MSSTVPPPACFPLRTQSTVVARLRTNRNAAIVSTLIVARSIAHFLPNLGELTRYIRLVLLTIEVPESAEHLKRLPDCIDPSHRFLKRCACLRAAHDKGRSNHTLNWVRHCAVFSQARRHAWPVWISTVANRPNHSSTLRLRLRGSEGRLATTRLHITDPGWTSDFEICHSSNLDECRVVTYRRQAAKGWARQRSA